MLALNELLSIPKETTYFEPVDLEDVILNINQNLHVFLKGTTKSN